MRAFYRRRSGAESLSEVDLNETIQEVIELTRPRWRDISQRNGIAIEFQQQLQRPLPGLMTDPSEIREALINLIFNAVDALSRGGIITFATYHREIQKEGGNERHLFLEVRDNGVGMDEKTRQRCLEPFFSTKSLRGGTGLGLAMVYGMMQRHDGQIEVESAPGVGTCMRLVFPLHPKTELAVPVATVPQPPRSLRVLCIDDDETIRQLLNDCLTQFNHQVTTAAGGEEALTLFRSAQQSGQAYEVIITDLGMPKMDGHQLARAIKAEVPKMPIVMMTGWGSMMKEDGETAPNVDVLVAKPPQLLELNDLLLRLVPEKKATPA